MRLQNQNLFILHQLKKEYEPSYIEKHLQLSPTSDLITQLMFSLMSLYALCWQLFIFCHTQKRNIYTVRNNNRIYNTTKEKYGSSYNVIE